MDRLFDDKDVNPCVRRILKRKAREQVGVADYTPDDAADIAQDLLLHLLEHPLQIDPRRGTMVSIVGCVLDHKRSHMVAARRAAKRNHGRPPLSLSGPINHDEGESRTREDAYDMDTYLQLTGKTSRPVTELQDLRLDVERFLHSLPPDLRLMATLLMSHRKTEVARMLGLPWSTFCDRCRELRHRMRRWRLNEYLQTSGKSRRNPVSHQ